MKKLLMLSMLLSMTSVWATPNRIECDGFIRTQGRSANVDIELWSDHDNNSLRVDEIRVNFRTLFGIFSTFETTWRCSQGEVCWEVSGAGGFNQRFQLNFREDDLADHDGGFFTARLIDRGFFDRMWGGTQFINCRHW